jgi:hypothetical protein
MSGAEFRMQNGGRNDEVEGELTGALRAWAASLEGVGAPAAVEARLRTAFRRRRKRNYLWAGALAAAVLLAAALLTVQIPDRRGSAAVSARPAEIATEFIPMFYGQGLSPTESARLVRVRLPRSALASFGLPLAEDRRAGRIEADVILGEDGVARAIRFVRIHRSDEERKP